MFHQVHGEPVKNLLGLPDPGWGSGVVDVIVILQFIAMLIEVASYGFDDVSIHCVRYRKPLQAWNVQEQPK